MHDAAAPRRRRKRGGGAVMSWEGDKGWRLPRRKTASATWCPHASRSDLPPVAPEKSAASECVRAGNAGHGGLRCGHGKRIWGDVMEKTAATLQPTAWRRGESVWTRLCHALDLSGHLVSS